MSIVGRGPQSVKYDPILCMKSAERSELSGHGAVSPEPGYRRVYGEATKSASEASVFNKANPEHETARGTVRDPDRLTLLVWACRDNGTAAGLSSWPADRAPWGKADRLRIQGLSIGTSEPARGRRSVADRLAFRSREKVAYRGRVPVVVRGRESRPHGEGEQVSRMFAKKGK
jgi:hypothetical protein